MSAAVFLGVVMKFLVLLSLRIVILVVSNGNKEENMIRLKTLKQ